MPPTSSLSGSLRTSTPSSRMSGGRKKRKVNRESILQIVGEKLQHTRQEDEYDIIGRNVAEKLRKLEPTMRIFAESYKRRAF